MLDTLCHGYYGHLAGTVEAVLQANPGLADQPQPFAAGLQIILPELASAVTEQVMLWN